MRELAERSGVDVQRLRQLINLGILSPDAAGRFQPADTQPPPCCPRWNAPIAFLDLTGYTTLTEERGDRAVADLAARLVEPARSPSKA
jgi:class 3 adenylate cyclase